MFQGRKIQTNLWFLFIELKAQELCSFTADTDLRTPQGRLSVHVPDHTRAQAYRWTQWTRVRFHSKVTSSGSLALKIRTRSCIDHLPHNISPFLKTLALPRPLPFFLTLCLIRQYLILRRRTNQGRGKVEERREMEGEERLQEEEGREGGRKRQRNERPMDGRREAERENK